MMVPGQNHRDPWFAKFFKARLEDAKFLFQTKKGTPFIYPGTGTGGWEAALTNTLSPGDAVLSFRYGVFSHLWIDMMERLGLDARVIEQRWGGGADEEEMRKALMADRGHAIKAVCVVQNETATGITSDIAKIRQVMDECQHPALLMVDGVSRCGRGGGDGGGSGDGGSGDVGGGDGGSGDGGGGGVTRAGSPSDTLPWIDRRMI